ncbi:MAG: AmmeMemoRadiSam system protein B [Acidobacteria bacterium]|nr:AmmeMemoRadiSam system protein B [Acidobacteriota bacterium]
MIRKAAWGGKFYPGVNTTLTKMLQDLCPEGEAKTNAKAIVVPHAGYIYSGAVAGAVYSRVNLPSRFIILSPNHWEGMTRISTDTSSEWETTFGNVKIDTEIREKLLEKTNLVDENPRVHLKEHAIEVHLPFLQYLKGNDFTFLPISLIEPGYAALQELGTVLAEIIKESSDDIMIIASTDMSHYISAAEAEQMDMKAIKEILALNPEGLHDIVRKNGITMCGMPATVIALVASKILGAEKADLVKYTNSGEVSGDYDQVVGYAGVIIR